MEKTVTVIGGGLAGSEAALQLAARGVRVQLLEMRPATPTPVHKGGGLAELVCSNSLKSMKPDKPAGMLKDEMAALGSYLLECALESRVAAGGALAVDRERFSQMVERRVAQEPLVTRVTGEAVALDGVAVAYRDGGSGHGVSGETKRLEADAVIVATGPLTSDAFAPAIEDLTGQGHLAFFDAAAPIVMSDSLDHGTLFRQSRYGEEGGGDYLNAPFDKDEYARFIDALLQADRVISRDFETKDLFCACQPIEEVARRGENAPRFGMMKPVGLVDPRTGRRPYAAVQLRAEDAHATAYNLVGFQTNLTFPEQRRVFRLIPGLENAEFARYGVMHRNTFIDAPRLLDSRLRLKGSGDAVYFAGQVAGTEGYCEAIMSGLYAALCAYAGLRGMQLEPLPAETSFGSLIAYATDEATVDYQPMHVNFGVFPPLEKPERNKGARYAALTAREGRAIEAYATRLTASGLLSDRASRVHAKWHEAQAQAGFAGSGNGGVA